MLFKKISNLHQIGELKEKVKDKNGREIQIIKSKDDIFRSICEWKVAFDLKD